MAAHTYYIGCPNCQKRIDVVFRQEDFQLDGRHCWNCGVSYTRLFGLNERSAWSVPEEALAVISASDYVLPPSVAGDLARFYNHRQGGFDSFTFEVQAIDQETSAAFLKRNAQVIAKAITDQIKRP